MKKDDAKAALGRVLTWPAEAQKEAMPSLGPASVRPTARGPNGVILGFSDVRLDDLTKPLKTHINMKYGWLLISI